MDLCDHTAFQLHSLLSKKEICATEILDSLFERIENRESKLNAYISIFRENAYKKAREIDQKISSGSPIGSLTGIPIAIKDNICVNGWETTCGSRMLSEFISPYDAHVVSAIKNADGIIIGKTNMDEFAMGSSNETSYFGTAKNPHDYARTPGGSSGGSAACVASGEAVLALGSDTGGSVRQPAAFCGIVGLRPTYGRISRFGLVAFASSLDQIGTFSRDVSDAALLMNVIAGHDNRDSTSANRSVPDYTDSLVPGVKGLRVGVPNEYFTDELDSEVQRAMDCAIKKLSEHGAICEEVSLPHTNYGIAAYYLIATAEASSNLARYDGAHYGYRAENIKDLREMYVRSRSEGFGDEVRRRIMLGTYVLSAGYFDKYYLKAQKVRSLIREDFRNAFENYDVLLTPTTPTPAFRLDEKMDRPLEMYLSDIFTVPSALAGMPCMSIPYGKPSEDLPVGIQLITKPFAENLLFRVGFILETMA